MRISDYNANAANIASMGGFGFIYYDTDKAQKIQAPDKMFLTGIQAFTGTVIDSIQIFGDGTAIIPETGFMVPMGMTVLMCASEVSISSGKGIIYLGGV